MNRMWINQPSKYQPLHKLHGTKVLAETPIKNTRRIYFLSGSMVSMTVPKYCLSMGWNELESQVLND